MYIYIYTYIYIYILLNLKYFLDRIITHNIIKCDIISLIKMIEYDIVI